MSLSLMEHGTSFGRSGDSLLGGARIKGLSVADYLVVATALHHDLTVLHEDADFETVAKVVPELRQQRISALPEG